MIRRVLYDFELLLNQLGGWGLPNVQTLWASANSFWHKSRRFPVNRIGYIEEVKSILLQIYNT
ncbi:MAG: hypothetical protein KJ587_19945, partial [Alphaproteobacteria bacterium]|nr:hypothetical protein [Alphaproteobacteria bacterium]